MGLTDILENNGPTRIGNIDTVPDPGLIADRNCSLTFPNRQFPIKSRVGTGLYVGKYRWINNSEHNCTFFVSLHIILLEGATSGRSYV